MTRIIAIVGPSGSGKDTSARILSDITGIPVLVSYTTRPMREGEENGREHIFVSECHTPREEMLAYTEYGGYKYWTEVNQVNRIAIYVIDEVGLSDMVLRFPDIEVLCICIEASTSVRDMRGVAFERMMRDVNRGELPAQCTDIVHVLNDGPLEYLYYQLHEIDQSYIFPMIIDNE